MLAIIEALIKYMVKLRFYPYVCQTERKNILGIRVIQQFYVDDKGSTFSDTD